MTTSPEPSPYVRGLPIGVPLASGDRDMSRWEDFPRSGDLTPRPLDPPVLPELPRDGEDGPESCGICRRPDEDFVWVDDRWRLSHTADSPAVPAIVLLQPRAHHDFADFPPELTAELGPMLQRVERAILGLGGIGRVHIHRWGDGSAHLHWWLIARPEGMLQLRGALLPMWNRLIPPLAEDAWRAALTAIAASMTEGGGRAMR